MKRHLDTVLSLVLTLAAVATAGAVIWRQFFPNSAVISAFNSLTSEGIIQEPQFYPGWREWLANGTTLSSEIGPLDPAPVVIIEFSDLECPWCARFHHAVLKRTKGLFGSAVAVSFIHFPLGIHRFSEISAVAAECAGEQGRFAEFVEVLFLNQDSIGLRSWSSYGAAAGVPQITEFQTCVEDQRPLHRVQKGTALAGEIGINGTPTIFVNGWQFPRPPTEAELSLAVQNILNGREPFPNHR